MLLPKIPGQFLGKFEIYLSTIASKPELLRAVYDEVSPVRVELRFDIEALEVVAFSKHFEERPQGMLIPHYFVIFTTDGKVTFEKASR